MRRRNVRRPVLVQLADKMFNGEWWDPAIWVPLALFALIFLVAAALS